MISEVGSRVNSGGLVDGDGLELAADVHLVAERAELEHAAADGGPFLLREVFAGEHEHLVGIGAGHVDVVFIEIDGV